LTILRREAPYLVVVLALSVAIWIFGILESRPNGAFTANFDRGVLLSLRRTDDLSKPIGPPVFVTALRDITALGSTTVIGFITIAVAGLIALNGQPRKALLVCISVASGSGLSTLLKGFFGRARPDVVPYLAPHSAASFPSGHALLSAVAFLTIGALAARSVERRRLKIYIFVLSIVATVIVGCSRVYLGVHWPTDVIAGWIVGAGWALLFWRIGAYL
jgi:undecaprenyl-diphosphatase